MKAFSAFLAATFLLGRAPLPAAEQIIVLGDSLTFAYEASFAFNKTINGTSYGDGFGSGVRNWIEILSSSSYRQNSFDLGARDSISVFSLSPFGFVQLYFRQKNNWAIPGLKVDQLRRFVSGDATVTELLAEDPDFASLNTALNFSDFNEDADFNVADLETQIATTAERLTFFIGGNDINAIYGTIYGGGSPGAFVDDFIADSAFILDWVLDLNPSIQIVVVNVPHVGITPDVQLTYPTDPVKTALVTSVLADLNSRLATLAEERELAYADIFTPTLPLLNPAPLCIHGLQFTNSGSTTGDLNYVWLNGPVSANFHPNTNAQAVIANTIVDAFNRRYATGIAPLTATEILGGLLGKSAAAIDMNYATWISNHALPGATDIDDSDGDGIPTGVEFGLGLNPTLSDGWKVASRLVSGTSGRELELSYPLRLTTTTRFTLRPASAANSLDPFIPFTTPPVPGADGLARARISATGPRAFLRLNCTLP
ncbi:SGNH/GDSL hydrolase family protein [Luteolibacter arcticus]|uniref:SGNH/GDSL hydrolase family protein n=1 Tax=Luteolibacter arcticus TaxID=1581411 RepID=A0ABT3GHH0_9BACT|nr:SGNH/GDSL hydrolase family protein [Luteolibacter arcticus]MCW1923029.1 SGNH/GDSL hydrolase family protein [Luteolibacter arcticus]